MLLVVLLTGDALDDAAAAELAGDLGLVAYEARMTVAAGYPAIVSTTTDAARAHDLVARLRAHGRDAVACDAGEIVSSGAMHPLDHFTLDAAGVTSAGATLPFREILCLLRATHKAHSATETASTERKFSAARSLLSGGLSNTRVVETRIKESSESREQVLYLFGPPGSVPWILHEQGTHYEGLGPALSRTTMENFATTVRLLRERAPHAVYDERLVSRARVSERAVRQGTAARSTVSSSSASGVDVLAHLVSLAIARERSGSPYRR